MPVLNIEHNLDSDELCEVLEKAIRRLRVPKEIKGLDDPFTRGLAKRCSELFLDESGAMTRRIAEVLTREDPE